MTDYSNTVNLTAALLILHNLMIKISNIYTGYRYPAQSISYAVWLIFLYFKKSLVAKGIIMRDETIRPQLISKFILKDKNELFYLYDEVQLN